MSSYVSARTTMIARVADQLCATLGVSRDDVEAVREAQRLLARATDPVRLVAGLPARTRAALGVLAPQQWSVVRSVPRSLRGMHHHVRHDECVSVVAGRMSVGLYDLRVDSETFGRSALYDLTGADPAHLCFPRGLVHGWVAHEATTHLQAVSETYASYGADDNNGCRWDDPELDLPWPVTPTVFSERSRSFGPLAELRRLTEQTLPAH